MYDIILFGCTGFTGKLAVEYLLKKQYPVSWAACGRNERRAQAVLEEIAARVAQPVPPLVVADLVCPTPQEEDKLRAVVKSCKVVLTTAGPFEKYGVTLHKICAEEGVHYADITGETSFVRLVIEKHDDLARQGKKATLVSHCGADCIPQDLTVLEMHEYAKRKGGILKQVTTLLEVPDEASLSGGTLTTAMFQLSKPKHKKSDTAAFDPLVKTLDGTKSLFVTKVTHKSSQYHADHGRKASPWLMSPVMANCVRRSNALLGYAPELKYGDAKLEGKSLSTWLTGTIYTGLIGAALYFPPLQRFLPEPGEVCHVICVGRLVLVRGCLIEIVFLLTVSSFKLPTRGLIGKPWNVVL